MLEALVTMMHRLLPLLAAMLFADAALAFRSCDLENSEAFEARTRYVVGEIDFDAVTGAAGGTETTYNYSNRGEAGFTECHVTYELSGSYEPVSRTFLLNARRSNHSSVCPASLIKFRYPDELVYSLQVSFADDGEPVVLQAASGQFFAEATWSEGRTAYKTGEECTIF